MIYLDHNATTPVDERVIEAMQPYLRGFYGNPSGLYRLGRLCRSAVDRAREQVAALVGAQAAEVIFTSGGTEANNLALKGMAMRLEPGVILAGATEHPSVNQSLDCLTSRGWKVETLPVDQDGVHAVKEIGPAGAGELRLGTLMLANNETGVIHELGHLAERLSAAGGFLHSDAVQAAGKIPVDFVRLGVHTLALSAHKIYGPKGVGALIAKRTVPIEPLLHGGGQELGRRAGTENVAGIVGFGKAAELARMELEQRRNHALDLRQRLERGLDSLPNLTVFARQAERLPNTIQFGMSGFDGEALVMALDRLGFAVSSGSACASGGNEPSPVLMAMGAGATVARSAVRVSFGQGNTATHVEQLLDALRGLLASPPLSGR